ncbi:hypothetical protein EIP86_007983 [Pleurotus ostreatoroseus]|nr:hypothetical protein EIP86_007983 [Pleurotus ostreatoroseus]
MTESVNNSDLLAELELLRSKYQELLQEKERIERQYQADCKKWREFRTWIISGTTKTTASTSSEDPTSYARYKGRGRYAQEFAVNDTINAQYRVDPARNDGVAFPFNEVVRKKCTRQHLEAEVCECCREYYEAVPTNSSRSRPPVWRSPPKTPTKRRVDELHDVTPSRSNNEAAKKAHRQEISKHRQRWVAPSTPPKYWDIGFPSTQEVAKINEEGKERQERKRREIVHQARNGGAYVKRDGS